MAIWLWLTMAYVLSQNKLLMQWLEAQNLEKERKKKQRQAVLVFFTPNKLGSVQRHHWAYVWRRRSHHQDPHQRWCFSLHWYFGGCFLFFLFLSRFYMLMKLDDLKGVIPASGQRLVQRQPIKLWNLKLKNKYSKWSCSCLTILAFLLKKNWKFYFIVLHQLV